MSSKPRIILLPVLLMTVCLGVSGLFVDRFLSAKFEAQLEREFLRMASAFANSLELLDTLPRESAQSLAIHLAGTSGGRITLIDGTGRVLGDSEVSKAFLKTLDNHADRPEIVAAFTHGFGQARRFSPTLKQDMLYTAVRFSNKDQGMALRLAIPLEEFSNMLWQQRGGLLLLGLVTIFGTAGVGGLASRRWAKNLEWEYTCLESRIEKRAEHISQLQTMSTLLSACESLDEIWMILTRRVPIVLPESYGGISLFRSSRNQLENAAQWGEGWQGLEIFKPSSCWALRKGAPHKPGSDIECDNWVAKTGYETICIPMVAQGETLGVMQFTASVGYWTEINSGLAHAVSEQTGLAIANQMLRSTLQRQAIVDPLTGLYNRRYLQETFAKEIKRAQRHDTPVSILMCDLDHFKQLNDTFGHEAGDTVLKEFGKLLQEVVRGEDVACRYGGEEFVILLPETDLYQALEVAQRICTGLRAQDIHHGDMDLQPVTVSVGAAAYPGHGSDDTTLLAAADKALYQAKEAGRNRVETAE